MYSKDKTGGLGDDGQAWALETVQQLVVDLGNNPKIANLIAECQLYFPDAPLKKPAQE